MRLRGLPLLALAFTAGAAIAETPRISLVFGADSVNVQAEDIRSVRRVDDGERGSALVIRLAMRFGKLLEALTAAHVGETGQILICGEVALEPYLDAPVIDPMFVISDTDPGRIDHLQALLTGPRCGPGTDS